ncbi:MAG: septum formation protein Maf [Alphaproteobacteria bacterium]|nr:septum formation protein Maf [Alphaproteobacteria bacterium]
MSSIVLASGSTTRQRLLRAAGVVFSVDVAHVDEASVIESLIAEMAPPRDVADLLAELKAAKVSARHPQAFVIGADQVLSAGQELFQKPGTVAGAREQLRRLRGRTHVLSSAVCVAREGSVVWRVVQEARLEMRDFSDAFLESYLADAGEDILGSVGAYHVEGSGIQLFSKIDGDTFTILGLPLVPLLDFLRTHGMLKA